MATLNEKQAKLFTDRNWGVIATIREDGSPQAPPVWIDYDGENVLVNSPRGRTKITNIERDPRATVTVLPAEDQQSGYVMVSGPATITEDGAVEHINMLAKKYLGQDKYPYLGPGEQRVIIKIHPERIDGFGAGGKGPPRDTRPRRTRVERPEHAGSCERRRLAWRSEPIHGSTHAPHEGTSAPPVRRRSARSHVRVGQ